MLVGSRKSAGMRQVSRFPAVEFQDIVCKNIHPEYVQTDEH